jgi:hypothetical protein
MNQSPYPFIRRLEQRWWGKAAVFATICLVTALILTLLAWTNAFGAERQRSVCGSVRPEPSRIACKYDHGLIGHSHGKVWYSATVKHKLIARHAAHTKVVETAAMKASWWDHFKDGIKCAYYGASTLNAIKCAGATMGQYVKDITRWSFVCGGSGWVGEIIVTGAATFRGGAAGAGVCIFQQYNSLLSSLFPKA